MNALIESLIKKTLEKADSFLDKNDYGNAEKCILMAENLSGIAMAMAKTRETNSHA